VKAAAQKRREQVVQRLEEILLELEGRLPLPTGRVGAGLLDALEIADRIRRVVRAEAKTLLRKAPGALPGWSVSRNGAPERGEREPTMVIRSHHRKSAIRLVQRPRILK
jgi:hypothetical protein